ncbi:hypothetical protein ACQEVZ_31245 [Dactylosporangium sp. CA-152071]|uniref:hypothetical protein n=1 Tax=Dactylosporangium sp. CA-152071 TaxID=3239933 RepID=UPI003D94645C
MTATLLAGKATAAAIKAEPPRPVKALAAGPMTRTMILANARHPRRPPLFLNAGAKPVS